MRGRRGVCWFRARAGGTGFAHCLGTDTFGNRAFTNRNSRPFPGSRAFATRRSGYASRAVRRYATIRSGFFLFARSFGFCLGCRAITGRAVAGRWSRGGGRRFLASSEAPESSSTSLGRLLQEGPALLESEALRVALLRNLRVLLFVGDVRTIAAIQHLNAVVGKIENQTGGVRLFLEANDLERALEGHRVRIVFLERDILAAVFYVRPELAYVGDDLLTLRGFPEGAWKSEQVHRVVERDGVHFLT